MDMGDLRGIATILCFVAFLSIVWWAYSPARRKRFDDAAQIPFEEENESEVNEHEEQGK